MPPSVAVCARTAAPAPSAASLAARRAGGERLEHARETPDVVGRRLAVAGEVAVHASEQIGDLGQLVAVARTGDGAEHRVEHPQRAGLERVQRLHAANQLAAQLVRHAQAAAPAVSPDFSSGCPSRPHFGTPPSTTWITCSPP